MKKSTVSLLFFILKRWALEVAWNSPECILVPPLGHIIDCACTVTCANCPLLFHALAFVNHLSHLQGNRFFQWHGRGRSVQFFVKNDQSQNHWCWRLRLPEGATSRWRFDSDTASWRQQLRFDQKLGGCQALIQNLRLFNAIRTIIMLLETCTVYRNTYRGHPESTVKTGLQER